MIQVNIIFSRKDVSMPWLPQTETSTKTAYSDHVNTTYRDTKQIVSQSFFVSPDKMSVVYTTLWDTLEHYNTYVSDTALTAYREELTEYRTANNIIHTPVHIVTI